MNNTNMNFKAAAAYLCVSTSKLYKMTHKREIPHHKIGRLVFKQNELDAFLESKRILSNQELNLLVEDNLKRVYKDSDRKTV